MTACLTEAEFLCLWAFLRQWPDILGAKGWHNVMLRPMTQPFDGIGVHFPIQSIWNLYAFIFISPI